MSTPRVEIPSQGPALVARWLVLALTALAPAASGQSCDNLFPSGDTTGASDWSNIASCLGGAGHHATLAAGTFYINQGMRFNAPNTTLAGAGRSAPGGTTIQWIVALVRNRSR